MFYRIYFLKLSGKNVGEDGKDDCISKILDGMLGCPSAGELEVVHHQDSWISRIQISLDPEPDNTENPHTKPTEVAFQRCLYDEFYLKLE